MTTSTLAFGKANASGSLKLLKQAMKFYSTVPAPASSNGTAPHLKPADRAAQRDLFVDILTASATKRDAKQYLARFQPPKALAKPQALELKRIQEERNARHRRDQERLDRIGVNLGGLYAPARAIAESPQFVRWDVDDNTDTTRQTKIHVALVCLRAPESLDDSTLDGVALTLSQLVKLDMRVMVLLDCESQLDGMSDSGGPPATSIKRMFTEHGERLRAAISRHSPEGARMVTEAIEVSEDTLLSSRPNDQKVLSVSLPKLLLRPLERSMIPIVPTLAYTPSGQLVHAPSSSVMPSLSAMLSGLNSSSSTGSENGSSVETSLDRIIILDSAGGIPSKVREDSAHVFINLEQEFDEIEAELSDYGREIARDESTPWVRNVYDQHRANLSMLQECLALLPSASSALIISPQEAAASSSQKNMKSEESTIGTGTRRQKNTVIHNLLTNKPVVSSSLPVARIPSTSPTLDSAAVIMPRATLVKRGMPLTIIPAGDRTLGWQVPESGTTSLSLEDDPRVDLPRLVYLINDSFRRKLDVRRYLDRIQNRIAGLIVAGEYEGGAILTWEMPPGTSDPARLVPYLDKFAVLASSQGSAGVADILFQAMVRTCFPKGVCWRSRKDNPVNKWYFERSDGTWQIPQTNWTMFWTGEGVVENESRWNDYVGVCTNVQPTWADGKRPD